MDPRHLPIDFREFLECLNGSGAEYLLVGGHAVCFHGYARMTSDMDVWFGATPENAERVLKAVRRFFGDEMAGLTVEQLLDPGHVTHFGARPYLIELLNRVSGGDFEKAWRNRVQVVHDGVPINFIALEDLLLNKRASGRSKDTADIENLT